MVTRRVIAVWRIGVALNVVAVGGEPRKVSGRVIDEAGTIDPEATVTGSDHGKPLGEALSKMPKPLGVRPAIRDGVILLTRP